MIKSLITLTLLGVFVASAPEAGEWKLRKNEDGIVVHTRKVEGSPVLEYKAIMTVDVPLGRVLAFYEKENLMTEWFYQCTESKLLEQKSPDEKILYFALGMPWPVSDRDSVYKRVKTVDSATGEVTFTISALPDYLPEKEGRVRVPYTHTIWRFTPHEGKTEVYFQQHSSAGGILPDTLVNKLVLSIPLKSFKNFRRLLAAQTPENS